jgi:V8-like Glu-specific endopeptidase
MTHARTARLQRPFVVVSAWLVIAACANEESKPKAITDPIAAGLMSPSWLGVSLGVAPPTFVDRGEVAIVSGSQAGSTAVTISPSSGEFVHGDELAFNVTDYATGHHYDVELPANIGVVAAAQAQRQLASQPMDTAGAAAVPESKSISGTDTRVRMSVADGVSDKGYAAAIGELDGGGCTGTLISTNAYLTAAHCVITHGGLRVRRDFKPRGDVGLPWGLWTATQAAVPQAYMNNHCYEAGDYKPECIQYDIAFVRVRQDESYPGNNWFFRPAAETRAELLTRTLRNRGYPLCDKTDHPADCSIGFLYGDRLPCALGGEADGDSGSLYRPVTHHGCDTSEGHSGGPMFYFDAQGRPVLIGVHVSGNTGDSEATPNSFKRLSPNTLDWINGLL